jgi:hypothetical protein
MTKRTCAALFVAAAVLVSVSCGGAPTAPGEPGVHFLYIEGQSVLAPGETTQLSASEMRAGQSISNVTAPARWVSADSSIAAIQRGLLRALAPGKTSISTDFQGGAGSADVHVIVPARAPTNVLGQFVGTVRYTSSIRIAGEGPNPFRDQVGRPFLLELTLTEQSNASVSGTLLVIHRTVGPVRGHFDATGELNLSGTLGIAGEPLSSMVRRLRVRFDGTRMTGAGEGDVAMINAFGPQLMKQTFDVEATLK